MILDNPSPRPTPIKVDAVNYDTLFPDMSPMLFLFANLTLILARDAEESKKHTFLPTLAIDANSRKWWGYFKVKMSIYMDKLSASYAINLHFLISSSKFLPYLLANKIPPSCPKPSFRTQVYAAAARFA
jgi:hypothetical protein